MASLLLSRYLGLPVCTASLLLSTPAQALAAADLPPQAEIAVSGILLDDPGSAKAPFGAPPRLDDPDSDNPKAFFCNRDDSERLTLVYHEGDIANTVSELRVERVETRYIDCAHPASAMDHFISGKGIQLGMTLEAVAQILGKNFKEHAELGEIVISYRIENAKTSDFLQLHDAPSYYGQYHFRNNRLVKFDFGFEYPY